MFNQKMSKGLMIIAVLAMLQAVLRMYFAVAGSGALGPGPMNDLHNTITSPMTKGDWTILTIVFGSIGALGLAAAIGLLMTTNWGYYGTVAISAITIAYDVWAAVAIQATAVLGIVLPAVFIAYLEAKKGSLLRPEASIVDGGVGS